MDGAQEVTCGLVVARDDGAVLLKPGKEVLDQVTRLVQVQVIAALVPARGFRGNHHGLAGLMRRLDHSGLRIVGLVCDDTGTRRVLEQHVSAFQVMSLPGREVKARWVAQRVDHGMYLGAQAAACGLFAVLGSRARTDARCLPRSRVEDS